MKILKCSGCWSFGHGLRAKGVKWLMRKRMTGDQPSPTSVPSRSYPHALLPFFPFFLVLVTVSFSSLLLQSTTIIIIICSPTHACYLHVCSFSPSLITFLSYPFSLLHSSRSSLSLSLSLSLCSIFFPFWGLTDWLTDLTWLSFSFVFWPACVGFFFFGEWKINTRQFEIPTSQISLRLAEIAEIGFWLGFGFVWVEIGFRVGFLNWFPEVLGVGFRRILWQGTTVWRALLYTKRFALDADIW